LEEFAQKLLSRGKETLQFNQLSDPTESRDAPSRIVTNRGVLKNSALVLQKKEMVHGESKQTKN
jgi:hypothetical protein